MAHGSAFHAFLSAKILLGTADGPAFVNGCSERISTIFNQHSHPTIAVFSRQRLYEHSKNMKR